MQIKEIMTATPELLFTSATICDAAKKMQELNVGFLPIGDKEKDKLIGTVTDRDLVISAIADNKDFNTPITNVMHKGIEFCFETDDIEKAAKHMKDKQIRRLVVLNKDKRLAGVLSLGDIAIHCQEELTGETLEEISKH